MRILIKRWAPLREPKHALLQHAIDVRQTLIRYDNPHPSSLNPPAVRALKAHDHTWLARLPEDRLVPDLRGPRRGQAQLPRRRLARARTLSLGQPVMKIMGMR
jgi:hypothetical protein